MKNKIVGVKFKEAGKVYYFSTQQKLNLDDLVVVETSRGLELGKVATELIDKKQANLISDLKPILRKANAKDIARSEEFHKKSQEAIITCQQIVDRMKLNMRFVQCEYTLDGAKIIFMYVSEERVDFRELLKELAGRFKKRIELRQIGARDKAKMIGGLGVCGLPICCSTFLTEFGIVSINMAKNQGLALNIPKLSGSCGKLMCCLKYENENYKELRVGFPKINQKIIYQGQQYKVTGLNILTRQVKIENPEDTQFIDVDLICLEG